MSAPRIAIVHDWLTGMRGGEKVLLELCKLFPSAPIYTLLWKPGSVHPEIEKRIRQTSFLEKLPWAATAYRHYLPLFPSAVRSLTIHDADVVISSSHAVAKGVRVPDGATHVSYVHTPMRYLWDETGSYFRFGTARRSRRVALALIAPYLRRFDVETARAVDHFIANSHNVRDRIRRIYQADAAVIHPPVDTDFFRPAPRQSDDGYYLCVSSLEPYKRIDLAIEAFRRLGRRLVVVGDGTQKPALRRLAASATSSSIEFAGRVSCERLRLLYQNCRAVVFPGIEDFGIVPVEAQACGKPVICYGRGGAVESVIDGETGVHFLPQQADALIAAIEKAGATAWDAQHLRENSLRFSAACFRDRMEAFLRAHLGLSLPSCTSTDVHTNPVRLP